LAIFALTIFDPPVEQLFPFSAQATTPSFLQMLEWVWFMFSPSFGPAELGTLRAEVGLDRE
jgi:hypothetical protein